MELHAVPHDGAAQQQEYEQAFNGVDEGNGVISPATLGEARDPLVSVPRDPLVSVRPHQAVESWSSSCNVSPGCSVQLFAGLGKRLSAEASSAIFRELGRLALHSKR